MICHCFCSSTNSPYSLQTITMADTNAVNSVIEFSVEEKLLKSLKDNKFNLYLLRDVNEGSATKDGNVIFITFPYELLTTGTLKFQWEDKYQVFLTNDAEVGIHIFFLVDGAGLRTCPFKVGSEVGAQTKVPEITYGQQITFDKYGEPATAVIPTKNSFQVINNWLANAHVGVNTYDKVQKKFSPIYVSAAKPNPSTSSLTPIDKFSLFWGAELHTAVIIDVTTTPRFQFGFLGTKKMATLRYQETSGVAGWSQIN